MSRFPEKPAFLALPVHFPLPPTPVHLAHSPAISCLFPQAPTALSPSLCPCTFPNGMSSSQYLCVLQAARKPSEGKTHTGLMNSETVPSLVPACVTLEGCGTSRNLYILLCKTGIKTSQRAAGNDVLQFYLEYPIWKEI